MNQVMSIIKSRRSIRRYSGRAVPDDIAGEIIEAGRYAPSGLNKQPWKFIVITDRDVIEELSRIIKQNARDIIKFLPLLKLLKPALRDPKVLGAIKKTVSGEGDTVFYGAPLLIIIVSDLEEGLFTSRDCALAAENMMLYAHSVGVGSCFIGRADLLARSKRAQAIIKLPARHAIRCALVFGYPAEEGKELTPPERRKDNIINWIR